MRSKPNKGWRNWAVLGAIVATGAVLSAPPAFTQELDPDLPEYQKQEGLSGGLTSVGSDTLNNLMTFWSEAFRKHYPNVTVSVEGKGSSTAPPALISGTANLAPMSRQMKSTEIEEFEDKYGFKPARISVALDALAVYVNKDNPVETLSLPEVDAIFSKTRRGGYPDDIATWGQVGAGGNWANQPISLYGRNSASGTYGFFKENALFSGDYKDQVKEQPGSASVVNSVSSDRSGIGYSGIGYRTSGVNVVNLSEEAGGEAYAPTMDNVFSGDYPLGRMLYIYVVKRPNEPLPEEVHEFLKMVLSKEGQQIVVKDGYMPLPARVVESQLASLEE